MGASIHFALYQGCKNMMESLACPLGCIVSMMWIGCRTGTTCCYELSVWRSFPFAPELANQWTNSVAGNAFCAVVQW